MAKYAGRGACSCCKAPVEVYTDRNGLAYYKCGPCGVKLTHSKPQKSHAFIATIDRHADEDEAPAPVKEGASPPVPAAVLENSGKPASKGMFGFGGK